MNDLDSQLIFEAYNEQIIEEMNRRDFLKKLGTGAAIGATAAQSLVGAPKMKTPSAAEPPAITQNVKASQDYGYGGPKKGETFDDYLERLSKDDPDYSKMTPDEIYSHSMKQTIKTTQSLLDQMGKTIDSMDPSAPENKKFSDDFDKLLKQAQELFKKTGATKKRR